MRSVKLLCLLLIAVVARREAALGQCPSITLGGTPIICAGDSLAPLTYSSSSGTTRYNIAWYDTAVAAGFKELPAHIITIAGSLTPGDGGPATAARLSGPRQVAFDAAGNFYIADPNVNAIRKVSTSGIITTIAGNGITALGAGTYTGDGGPATAAGMNQPVGVAVNAAGEVFVSESGNNVIRKISTSGIITTIAGNGSNGYSGDGGPASAATLSTPGAMRLDAAGNLYFIDGYNLVRKISTTGIITTYAGNVSNYSVSGDGGPATNAGIPTAYGLAIDAAGNMYIAEYGYQIVRKVNTAGIISTVAGSFAYSGSYSGDGGPATAATLNQPFDVAVDGAGNLYIADANNNVIRKVTTSGIISTVAGNYSLGVGNTGDGGPATAGQLWNPRSISINSTGEMYLTTADRIRKVNTASILSTAAGAQRTYSGDGGAATAAGMTSPTAVASDAMGNIYIADAGNNAIRKVSKTGIITTIAGDGLGGTSFIAGPATATGMSSPMGILVDASGNIYYADTYNGAVRKIDTTGAVSTYAGGSFGYSGDGGPATDAAMSHPAALAMDPAGNIYIADVYNNVVRKVDASGIITTVAGNYSFSGYSGDGGPATDAAMYQPSSIAVDVAGNLYIGDYNNVVRKVNTSGIISTYAGGLGFSPTPPVYDGGPATSVYIGNPLALAVDSTGNLFIASGGDLLKVNSSGRIARYAGSGPGYVNDGGLATATTIGAFGLGFDNQGNLLVADLSFQGVRRISTIATLPSSPIGIKTPPTAYAGTYTGKLTVYNDSCHTAYPISIIIAPSAGPIGGSPATCIGSTALLPVPYTGGTWSSTVTSVATIGSTGIVTGIDGGTTIISYQLTSACGTTTATKTFMVNENPALGALPIACSGDTVANLTYSGQAGNPIYKIVWSDSAISTGFKEIPGRSAIINTVAGNTSSSPSSPLGDGGPATAGNLYAPAGVANDAAGNLYIADRIHYVVRKVSPDGVITTLAGINGSAGTSGDGGPATAAHLNYLTALAADVSGNVYITSGITIRRVNTAGIISTVAGNDSLGYGYSGDGGPATMAQLESPSGIAVDVAGNIYFSDQSANVVRRIDTSGVITTVAGNFSTGAGFSGDGGPATGALLNQPSGVVVDGHGNLLIADMYNYVIRKVDTNGIISTVIGVPGYPGVSGDGGPATAANIGTTSSIAIDRWNNVYIPDMNYNVVRRVNAAGTITSFAGHQYYTLFAGDGGPATAAGLFQPTGVSADRAGNVYISDQMYNVVRKVTETDTLPASAIALKVPPTAPNGVYHGSLYVFNGGCDTTYPITVTIAPSSGTIIGNTNVCAGSTFLLTDTSSGGTWSSSNTAIASVGSTGIVTTYTGGLDTISYTVTSACGTRSAKAILNVNTLPAFTLGAAPIVCIGDTLANITYSSVAGTPQYSVSWNDTALATGFHSSGFGNINTVAGNYSLGAGYTGDGGPATAAEISTYSVHADNAGNYYLADVSDNVVRKVSPSGIISTFAGNGTAGSSGDGGSAVAAQLMYPQNAIADAAGNVYISEIASIRKVTPSGIITTIAGTTYYGYGGDGGPATAAQLHQPIGMVFDSLGNLFVADIGNNVIRRIDTAGIISTVVGNYYSGGGYSGDGGPASAASLNQPYGLAFDHNGNLCFTELGNQIVRSVNAAGIISTVAGNGSAGFSGDGGPATAGQLWAPCGLAADASGNLFIADQTNNTIRKISASGIITSVAGSHTYGYSGDGGPATDATLRTPIDVALDQAGNLLIADVSNGLIRKVDRGILLPASPLVQQVPSSAPAGTYHGTITLYNGPCSTTYPISVAIASPVGPIGGPATLCVGSTASLFETTAGGIWTSSNTSVATIGSTGVVTAIAPGITTIHYDAPGACGSGTAAHNVTVNATPSITLGSNPTVCAGDTVASLSYTATTGSPAYAISWSDTAEGQGFIGTPAIVSTVAGNNALGYSYSGDGGPATDAGMTSARGVYVDNNGNLYISDGGNGLVRKVDPSGIITTVAGNGSGYYSGDGSPATAVGLNQPSGLTTDAAGNLYFADFYNNAVRKVDVSGIITTVAGALPFGGYSGDGGPASAAALYQPSDVKIDASGNIYIADQFNNVIRKINTSGIITTVAGSGTIGYYGDGGPATDASLQRPAAIHIDGSGNLLIADMGNNLVRKVSTAGIITTIAGNHFVDSIIAFPTGTYRGDGRMATDAGLNSPAGLATDANGNIYIAEIGNNIVRKVNNAGIISTYAGHYGGYGYAGDNGPATAALFSGINSVTIDAQGNLYIGDPNNYVVRKLSPFAALPASPLAIPVPPAAANGTYHGHLTVQSGSCAAIYPFSVTLAPGAGSIHGLPLMCAGSTTTLTDTASGGSWSSSNTAVATVASSGIVTGVAAGTANIVYTHTGGCGSRSVGKSVTVNPSPAVTLGADPAICAGDTTALLAFSGLAGSPVYGLSWSDSATARGFISTSPIITTIAGDPFGGYSGDGGPASAATLYGPNGLTSDGLGNFYFTQSGGYIRKIDAAGIVSTIAGSGGYSYGGDGGPATDASLVPFNIAADREGNVYIAEMGKIRKVNTAGIISTVAGIGNGISGMGGYSGDGGPAVNALFSTYTTGIAVDHAGNIYIGDQTNHVVRKVNTSGIVTTIAGNGTSGYSGDGGPATNAQLTLTTTVAVDGAGNVYVADELNNVIRKVDTGGIITTIAGNGTSGYSGDGGPATDAMIYVPYHIISDDAGNVYFSDEGNAVIRKVSTSGIITTVAGNNSLGYGYSGDGGPATAAQIQSSGLTLGINGELVFGSNTALRKVANGAAFSGSPLAIAVPDTAGAGVYTGYLTLYSGSCNTTYPVHVNISGHTPDSGVITGVTVLTVGATTTLHDAATGGVWSSADTSVATISSGGVVTALAPGTSVISYAVTNACGTSVATKVVTVNPLLAPITGRSTVCNGDTIALHDSTVGGTWSSSNTSVATVSTTGIVTASAAGIDTIRYTVSGNTVIKVITVNPAPAIISGTTTVCISAFTTLSDTSAGGIWSSASPGIASIGSLTGVVAGVTAGTANVTYTLPAGCFTSTSVIVNALPVITTGTPAAVCAGTGVTVTASGGVSYSWSPATGLSSATGASVIASPSVTTTYTVTGTNSNGCVNRAVVTVSVNAVPVVAASPSVAICAAASTTLTASGGLSYSWSPATGLSASTGSSVLASPLATTTYTVVGTNGSGCSNRATVTVTVNSLPAIGASVSSPICIGSSATLTATGGTTYSWAPSVGLSATVGATVTATPTVTTTYTVTGVAAGCSNMAVAVVTVNALPNISNFTAPSAVAACLGQSSIVTVNSTSLGAGTFTVTYNLSGANASTANTAILSMGTSNGTFTIPSSKLTTAGATTVTITAITNASGCVRNITTSNTATFTVQPLPGVYAVTGGGSFCSGGTGVTIGLSGSQSGVNYQLYLGSTASGSPVAGTGAAISFGLKTAVGTYTVSATTAATGCTNNMSGSVSVAASSLPTVFAVTGGGAYCAGGSGVHIGLSNSQTGINYQLYRGATADGSPVAGTGSPIDFGLRTTAATYTVVATAVSGGCTSNMSGSAVVTVNPSPTVYAMTGGGTFCAGGVGFHVGLSGSQTGASYQLYIGGTTAVGAPLSGTGSGLDWGYQTAGGTYTVVASIAGSCVTNMSGTAVITANPSPSAFSVTGGGGYCLGGTGVHIGLSGSQSAVNYQLYRGATIVGTPVAGTGAALDFGLITTAGTYTVTATGTTGSCGNTMSGSAVVSVTTPPSAYTVTGGGAYCSGGSGPHIGLANSAVGVNYQLYLGGSPVGSPVAGIGGALDLGGQTAAGTYTVVGTSAASGCSNPMSGSASVTVSSIPATYTVTGGGSMCSGGTGLHLGLSGSVTTVTYYLYKNGTSIGSLAGSGSPLDYGLYTAAGTYTVVALNTTTGCTSNQLGNAVITVVAPPSAGTITGPTVVHNGATITLVDGTAGGSWSASNGHVTVNSSGVVTGVTAGSVTVSYTVSNGVCAVSALQYITEAGPAPPQATGIISGNTAICVGDNAQFTNSIGGGKWSSSDPAIAQINADNGSLQGVSAGIAVVTYTIVVGGESIASFMPVVVNAAPDALSIAAVPGTAIQVGQEVTFTAAIANKAEAQSYQWQINGRDVRGAVAATFTTGSLTDDDIIACTAKGLCGNPVTASVKMKVLGTDNTAQPVAQGSIAVTPNPNKGAFIIKGSLGGNLNDEDVTIEITDVLGQSILQKTIIAKKGWINENIQLSSNVANGMYLLSLHSDSGSQVVHLIIEQ